MVTVFRMPKQQLEAVSEMRVCFQTPRETPPQPSQKANPGAKVMHVQQLQLSADKRTMLLSQSDGGVEMMVTVDLKPDLLSRWGTTVSCHCSMREKYSTYKARDAQSRC